MNWTHRDGWLLMAVHMSACDKPATLAQVIAAADATNHAIPTHGELSRAFSRLAEVGVLVATEDRFSIAPNYRETVEAALNTRGGLFAAGDKGLKWLRETSFSRTEPAAIAVSEADVAAAYREYTSAIRVERG